MNQLENISIGEIREAQKRLEGAAIRTPLLRWAGTDGPGRLYLKLECLQPIGSFKLRGGGNAMISAAPELLREGVWTASAGNMAQGVAWFARRLGIHCTAVVPDTAAETKLAAIRSLGADIIKVPFAEWWQVMMTHQFDRCRGLFIHPVANRNVMAGNGTIGLEILEELPDTHLILVPFGGGGLSCGIAAGAKGLNPTVKVIACEPETAAPLSPSLKAGQPLEIEYKRSFVDGAGGRCVLPQMWPLIQKLLDGARTVSLEATANAIRRLVEAHHVVAEGAGALSLAAGLESKEQDVNIVCVISGANIDASKLAAILQGTIPA